MTVRELFGILNERIPRVLSCDWDNDGLMCCPDGEREVKRVLIALDATGAVCDAAIEGGYDLIVTHHPFIFKGLRAVEDGNGLALKAMKLIKANISLMSFHTRLDCVAGGVNDALASALGLERVENFEGDGSPMGRVGELAEPMPLYSFAALVKEALGAPFVSFSDAGREVKRVAVLGGSGKDFLHTLCNGLGAVDDQGGVVGTCLGHLAAEATELIVGLALEGEHQDNDTLVIAGVSGKDLVNSVDVKRIFSLDDVGHISQLFLGGGVKHTHFDCHNSVNLR